VDCPRKFYLENTLKLAPTQEVMNVGVGDNLEGEIVSSSKRGSLIHEQISLGVGNNFVVGREHHLGEHHEAIGWALKELSGLVSDYQIISEEALKFPFFGFMISGIPDLVLFSRKTDGVTQIWDFKTGRKTDEKLVHYWTQLKIYAYAYYILGKTPMHKPTILKLSWVDQKKYSTLEITFEEVQTELFTLWQSQNSPWMIKTDHCSQCAYGDICHR
jgi:hypothetical protein